MKKPTIRHLLRYARIHQITLCKCIGYSFLHQVSTLLPSLLIALTVDLLANKEQSLIFSYGIENVELQLAFIALLTLVVWSNRSMLSYFSLLLWHGLSSRINTQLRRETFNQLQMLPMDQVEQLQNKDLIRLDEDLQDIRYFISSSLDHIVQMCAAFLIIVTSFYMIAPEMALIAIIPLPLFLFYGFHFQRKLQKKQTLFRRSSSRLGAEIGNSLSHLISFQTLNRENEFETLNQHFQKASDEEAGIRAAQTPFVQSAILIGTLGVILIGAHKALHSQISLLQFILLWLWTPALLKPFGSLSGIIQQYLNVSTALSRLLAILSMPTKTQNAQHHTNLNQSIYLQNIFFHYQPFTPIFHDLNLTIVSGQTTLIYGPKGSGKSALIKLMLGFYTPSSGEIKIGSTLLSDINRQYLHDNISYLGQDPYLFSGTILDNILASKTFDQARLLRISHALDLGFIDHFPNQLQTQLEDIAPSLSEREKRKITLARTLYRSSTLIIFDHFIDQIETSLREQLSSLLQQFCPDSTIIMISLNQCKTLKADQAYEMQNGHIRNTSYNTATPLSQ